MTIAGWPSLMANGSLTAFAESGVGKERLLRDLSDQAFMRLEHRVPFALAEIIAIREHLFRDGIVRSRWSLAASAGSEPAR